ncbi:DUF6165 family protein [Mesorhizobium sp. INR15]|uniref:DUF6165 family protein n=1 Tax=Mesorhizobium sp. INR15 TaxID=2654248 RepID=UPI00189680BA|nr:DUF6165 family protein [Mesorhizobium sp. INR15]
MPNTAGAAPGVQSLPAAANGPSPRERAEVLAARGNHAEAVTAWRQVLDLAYDDADAANKLGLALAATGKHDEAIAAFRRAIQYDARTPALRLNLANALLKGGRHGDARNCFEDFVAGAPNDADALVGLARAMRAQGKHEEALKPLQRAIDVKTDHVEALFEKASALKALKRNDDADAAYRLVLALDGKHREAGLDLAKILHEAKRHDEAVSFLDKVVSDHPGHLAGWIDLGSALLGTRQYPRALDAYKKALAIQPASAAALCNMSLALFGLERMEEGIAACKKALAIEPASNTAQFNIACMQLALGNYLEGWTAYEFRHAGPGKKATRDEAHAPPWFGEDLQGKSILVLGEQANGDYLQFARYASALQAMGAAVSMLIPKRLKGILSTLPGNVTLVTDLSPDGRFDYQCYMMSIPLRFERLGLPIPAEPYLSAEPQRIARWGAAIGDQGFRIGVAWQGGLYGERESTRAFTLQKLQPLSAVPGVRLISLQIGKGSEQIETLPPGMSVATLGPEFDAGEFSFLDTAAAIMAVDLVVTCDTSIAHLAGALGKPVWIALNESAEWRWQRAKSTTVWYPTVRLFRQKTARDWDPVFDEMAVALAEVVARQPAHLATKAPAKATSGPAPAPNVAVSWGECVDKITILEIKAERVRAPEALANIKHELDALRPSLSRLGSLLPQVEERQRELRAINETLWGIEDKIRECEARQQFDQHFVELARSVYIQNDERARVKRAINDLTRSAIVEEKFYRHYASEASSTAA